MRMWTSRMAIAVLALIVLRGLVGCWAEMQFGAWQRWGFDFWNYYVAAGMVRAHQSVQIYQEPGPDFDPTEDYAAAESPFVNAAHADGVEVGAPYDYPPTLADLAIPISLFRPAIALGIWEMLSVVAAFCSAYLLSQLLQLKIVPFTFLISVLTLVFRPTMVCLFWGQVELILLLVLLGGIALYGRGHHLAAGLLFSIATSIKLTPLILIVPLTAWRDWKTLRTFLLACGAILVCLVAVNGWTTIDFYFLHQLPHMTSRSIDPDNRGLVSALQVLAQRATQGTPLKSIALAGRVISLSIICCAAWLMRSGKDSSKSRPIKVEALSVFLLLSCCLSPLSWIHAYVLSIPALAIALKRIGDRVSDAIEIAGLMLFLFALSSEKFVFLEAMTPWLGVAFGLWFLHRVGTTRDPARQLVASSIA